MPEFVQLLRDGNIEPLSLGMSRSDVRHILGECEGTAGDDEALYEQRAAFQLLFVNDRLRQVKWSPSVGGGSTFTLQGELPVATTTVDQFLERIEAWDIVSWTIDERLTFDRQLAIRTGPMTLAMFNLDCRELQSIVVSNTAC